MHYAALPAFAPFERRADADARVASALNAVCALLAADLLPAHRRELLSTCLWKLSLAEPRSKYATRYVSAATLASGRSEWVHEHVNERVRLVDALVDGTLVPAALAAEVLACIVTKREHVRLGEAARLDPGLHGWARYRAARIAVVDRAAGTWLDAAWQGVP